MDHKSFYLLSIFRKSILVDVFGSLPCLVKYDFICSGSTIRVFRPEAEGSLLP